MPREEKAAYREKQKRQDRHIEEGYEYGGVSEEAERRAWTIVNKARVVVEKSPARAAGRKNDKDVHRTAGKESASRRKSE